MDSTSSTRIVGIDMARGIAMAGMVIVHLVAWREGEGGLYAAAELFRGRAMPLFMLLGGVGVTLMTARAATPTRNLLIRSAMLMALGLLLTEHIERLAIVLQSYSLFFVLSIVLWRLPSRALLTLVPIMLAIGSVTYQLVGTPREHTSYDDVLSYQGFETLLFDGFYPLFPVGAFFIFGMWLARLDLRSDRVAAMLLSIGATVGVAVRLAADAVVSGFDLQTDFGGNGGDGMFHLVRLLDFEGHSAMPAWTLGALGTSAATLGLSLLIAPLLPRLVYPLVVVGSMSLSFYVFQAWMTNMVPPTAETGVGLEWLFAIGTYLTFLAFAVIWRRVFRFGSGPLELILRLGSGPSRRSDGQKQPDPIGRQVV